jgi:hypothetical protein
LFAVPHAQFSASPNPSLTGQAVNFDASASTNTSPENHTEYAWDLDGDGKFETILDPPNFDQPLRAFPHVYSTPGTREVTLQVGNLYGYARGGNSLTEWYLNQYNIVRQTVVVKDPHVPAPALTVSPNPACSTGTVNMSAAGSSDSDGSIVNYKWDLDGDGSFETDTGTTPVASKSNYGRRPNTGAADPRRKITVRVTDDTGLTADLSQFLAIDDNICRGGAAAGVSAAAVEHKASFALTLKGRVASQGFRLATGKRLTISNFRAGGTARLSGLPTPLQRVRRAGWVANLSLSIDARTSRLRAQGQALLDLRRKGHLCTSLVIDRRKGRGATGRMQVLGGSGPARFVDGKAAYSGVAALRRPLKVRGRIEMERRAKGKGLTRACKALLPRRR